MKASLIHLIKAWDDVDWITKKHIEWIRIKSIYNLDFKFISTIVAVLSILGVFVLENDFNHLIIELSSITLIYFYLIFVVEKVLYN